MNARAATIAAVILAVCIALFVSLEIGETSDGEPGLAPGLSRPAGADPDPAELGLPRAGSPDTAQSGLARQDARAPLELCSLHVRVVDRADNKPAESAVELSRIHPEGDSSPVRVLVSREGALVEGLSPGTYRAHVRARVRASEDPPAFAVSPPRTEVVLPVTLPGTFRVTLSILDERGDVVRMARSASGYEVHPPHHPGFGERAVEVDPPEPGMSLGWRHLSVEPEGSFLLGQVQELDCDQGGLPWYELTPRGRTPVRVELPGHELSAPELFTEAPADLELIAVSLPESWFDQAIVLPDGSSARGAGAKIDVGCDALAIGADGEGPGREQVPVRVRSVLDGYLPLEFEYQLSEGTPTRRTMRAR